jgi:uncharacterized membrane protein
VTGPVQVLVVGFDRPAFSGAVLAELTRLKEAGVVRLIDLLLVSRTADGTLETVDTPAGLGADLGGLAAALLGQPHAGAGAGEAPAAEAGSSVAGSSVAGSSVAGSSAAGSSAAGHRAAGATDAAAWSLADAVPPGSAAAVALIEHLWAADLAGAIQRAGGRPLEETWLAAGDRALLDTLITQREQRAQRPTERG